MGHDVERRKPLEQDGTTVLPTKTFIDTAAGRALLADAGRAPDDAWIARVAATLEPINVAGLCDPEKRHWYGVDTADLLQGSSKLESSPEAIQAMLRDCGL